MALVSTSLSSSLKSDWLPNGDDNYPASASESGDAFAGAVVDWFGAAMAGSFPCSTATARRSQLASAAGAALKAGSAAAAGSQLALGLAAYLTGQVFGAGVASPPLATTAGGSAITSVFSDLDLAVSGRADKIASAVLTVVQSTIVVFPPVISAPAAVS